MMTIQGIGKPKRKRYTSVRQIDFAHFTYPDWSEGVKGGLYTLHRNMPSLNDLLKEIWLQLEDVKYCDITRDGKEEAIVVLALVTGGTASPNPIYIYTLHKRQPKLLWSFSTGDRIDGGLKNIYCKKGFLVLETFNPTNNKGACCPAFYEKQFYTWKNNSFHKFGNAQILPLKRHYTQNPNPVYMIHLNPRSRNVRTKTIKSPFFGVIETFKKKAK